MELSEFYESFFEEAEELLEDMEKHLLDLDVDAPDNELLHAIFRAAHSIKGGAGAFGFTRLQETTHLFENLLDFARHGQLQLRTDMVDFFLQTKDVLFDQIAAHRQGEDPDAAIFENTCATLKRLAQEAVADGDAAQKPADQSGKDGREQDDADPMTRICRVLQQIAREALGEDAAPLETETEEESEAEPARLKIAFLKVAADDRTLLLEELGHLGRVLEHQGDDERYEVTLETTEDAEGIEAVMCFIIEASQLSIETLAKKEEEKAPAPAPAATPALKEKSARAGKADKGAQASIRVPVNKVDQIINLVGELIITQSMLEQSALETEGQADNALETGLMQLQRNARDLQEAVMSIRMLPMEVVFSRYPRLVRDLSGKMGKQVELITEGESTELDKGLIEGITDPLTHLVRNSLDHGLETAEVRQAAGKPASGQLKLSARHLGGNILIEVSDDGAGLNRERILEKARSNGLDVNDDMSNDEVWQLIFAPGFSTAETVSDVSGRGVGMDVVKRNIHSLGGKVELLSTPGEGTTIRVLLPLTLAILDGMTVRVGEEMFVLPLTAVSELVQPAEDDLFSMTGEDILLKVRDEYLPVVALHEVMQVPGAVTRMTDAIAIIVYHEESSYALLVDEPVGQQQVVVKNLESNYRKVPGASAATILGDGRVALILDPAGLHHCEQARKQHKAKTATA